MSKKNLEQQLTSFNIERLASFLAQIGWSFKETDQDLYIVRSPLDQSGQSLTYLIPKSLSKETYDSDLIPLVRGISKVKKIEVEDVLKEIGSIELIEANKNITSALNFRIEYKKFNSLPIKSIQNIITNLTSCVEFAASMEIQNRFITWEEKPIKGVSKILEKIHFDQTRKGSFVGRLTTVGQLDHGEQIDLLRKSGLSQEHALFARLAKGLEEVSLFDFSKLKTEAGYLETVLSREHGLNGNMADSLIKVFSKNVPVINFDFEFHRTVMDAMGVSKTFYTLDQNFKSRLEEYKDALIVPREIELKMLLKPTSFNSKDPNDDSVPKNVSFLILSVNNVNISLRKLSAQLSKHNYEESVKAHLAGGSISVKALVHIEKGKMTLKEVYQFSIA